MNTVSPKKSIGQAAIELQAIVARARMAGELGSLNDGLSVEKLAVLLEVKLNAWGVPRVIKEGQGNRRVFPAHPC